jgi:hypothetical protein
MKPPTLICNTGLGDMYVLSGAIVYLARKHGGLRIPALPQYRRTLHQCFILHPEVEIFTILNDAAMLREYRDDRNTIRCHWTKYDEPSGLSWDRWLYGVLGVPFEERWSSCPLEEAASHQSQIIFAGPFYLVHEDPERGFPMPYAPWHPVIATRRIGMYGRHSPLAWVEAIRMAKELHFFDSSMWHLAESITIPRPQPKYIHRYMRPWHETWHAIQTRYYWIYLDGTPTPFMENLTRVKNRDEGQMEDSPATTEPSRGGLSTEAGGVDNSTSDHPSAISSTADETMAVVAPTSTTSDHQRMGG